MGLFNKNKKKTEGQVPYDPRVAQSHADMNPAQVVEPLTGSSVLVESASNQQQVPDNGFPIGYGPNAHMKKIEKPVKPKLSERLKYARKRMGKKQKVLLTIIPILIVVAIAGGIVYGSVTGEFKTDYSETYKKSKELRSQMQKLRSDASCSKVTEYVSNAYTSSETYQGYIESCRETGNGVPTDSLETVGNTEGVLRDEEVRKRYETLKSAFDAAKKGNEDVDGILDKYVVWHNWIVKEAKGNSIHNDWDWTEADIKNASEILIDSGVDEFKKYGENWAKYKLDAATAYNAYFHKPPQDLLTDYYTPMVEKQNEFTKFKKENEPDIESLFPLEMVDMAKLYAKFEEFYNFVRETYQNNYNYDAGGCIEQVNKVICD